MRFHIALILRILRQVSCSTLRDLKFLSILRLVFLMGFFILCGEFWCKVHERMEQIWMSKT